MNLKVIYHYFSFVLFFQQQINKLITFFSLFICRSDDDGSNYRRVTTISKMIELAPFQWLADNNQLLWRLLVQVQLHLETKMKKLFRTLSRFLFKKSSDCPFSIHSGQYVTFWIWRLFRKCKSSERRVTLTLHSVITWSLWKE